VTQHWLLLISQSVVHTKNKWDCTHLGPNELGLRFFVSWPTGNFLLQNTEYVRVIIPFFFITWRNLIYWCIWCIWYILRTFGMVWDNLVCFSLFWYVVPWKIWQPWWDDGGAYVLKLRFHALCRLINYYDCINVQITSRRLSKDVLFRFPENLTSLLCYSSFICFLITGRFIEHKAFLIKS
jgi:hypothetical protein